MSSKLLLLFLFGLVALAVAVPVENEDENADQLESDAADAVKAPLEETETEKQNDDDETESDDVNEEEPENEVAEQDSAQVSEDPRRRRRECRVYRVGCRWKCSGCRNYKFCRKTKCRIQKRCCKCGYKYPLLRCRLCHYRHIRKCPLYCRRCRSCYG